MASTRNLKVSINLPSESVFIHSDALRLIQILRNLLSNSIKYNKDNGWIRISVICEGSFAKISIADGGLGMGEDELKVLFDPYSRGATQRQIKGVGLGIVIVKKLVEAHGGQVNVKSKLAEGTTFTVTIPLEQEQGPAGGSEIDEKANEGLLPVVN